MKKFLITGLITVFMGQAFAAGGGTTPIKPINPIVDEILARLDLNPVLMRLAEEFNNARQAVSQRNGSGSVVVGEGINLGERYDCKIFYAVNDSQPVIKPIDETWYEFTNFGPFILENTSAFIGPGRIKHYTEARAFPGDLTGRSEDTTYWEAIRVDEFGGLIVEMEAPELAFVKAILNMLGLGQHINDITKEDMEGDGLMVPSVLGPALGFVLGYGYCPTNESSARNLNMMMNTFNN